MIAAGLLKAGAKQGACSRNVHSQVMDNDGKAMNCQQIKSDALALRLLIKDCCDLVNCLVVIW